MHTITTAMLVMVLQACNTTNRIHASNKNIAILHDSTLTDNDGNKYPVKVFLDSNLWMTANLNLKIPGSYCYENAVENCNRYGRLYTWESAQQVCKLLGAGWRLPTSAEWRQLSWLYGGVTADSNTIRKNAYKNLLYTGLSGFNALLGGGRTPDSQYTRLEAHGFYWTATEIDSATAWSYNFAKGSQALYQQNGGEKSRAFSVRCMKGMHSHPGVR